MKATSKWLTRNHFGSLTDTSLRQLRKRGHRRSMCFETVQKQTQRPRHRRVGTAHQRDVVPVRGQLGVDELDAFGGHSVRGDAPRENPHARRAEDEVLDEGHAAARDAPRDDVTIATEALKDRLRLSDGRHMQKRGLREELSRALPLASKLRGDDEDDDVVEESRDDGVRVAFRVDDDTEVDAARQNRRFHFARRRVEEPELHAGVTHDKLTHEAR